MPYKALDHAHSTLRILHLNLIGRWFDDIVAGGKHEEFRKFTPYWKARLASREYDVVEFRNGYAPDARRMRVEFKGVVVEGRGKQREFVIQLGRILTPPTRRSLKGSRPATELRSARQAAKVTSNLGGRRTARPAIRTPQDLRRIIGKLSPSSPITDRFSANWRSGARRGEGQQEQSKVWYRTQHEHWMGWLDAYRGPGAYNRKDHRRTAEFVYNHIVNPQMLIYLAEASRLPRPIVHRAAREAFAHSSTMASMSAAIRRTVPWSVIEEALT